MGKFLRFLMWLLLTALVVWLVVIAYWRFAGIRPDVRALVLYLGVLPVGTFTVLALFKHGMDNARNRAADAQEHAMQAGDKGDGEDPPEGRPAIPVGILASALQLPAGSDAAGVLGAMATPSTPELHKTLKDGSGYPVFAAWAEEVDIDAVMHAFEAAGGKDEDLRRLAEEQLRAFGLMLPVVQDLLARVAAEGWLEASTPSSGQPGAPLPSPRLHARIFLPAEWPAATRTLAVAWLEDEARNSGIPGDRLGVEAIPAVGSDDIWRHLADLAAPAPASTSAVHLVLACHSLLGERSVQRLDHAGRLLSAMRAEGIVPGEGAAGLVLLAASAEGAFAFAPEAVLRAHTTARDGVSWQPRTAIQQMEAHLEQTLAATPGLAREALQALVSDADLRRSRATAMACFAGQVLAHLDPETGSVATGSSCGHIGIVSPLALISLAAEKAASSGEPVLAAAVSEADQRTMALVTLPDPPAADEAAGSPSSARAT